MIDIKALVQAIANDQAVTCFVREYIRPDNREERQENGLGIAIANWAEWDGLKIMRVLGHALEDANFHDEAAIVRQLHDKEAGKNDCIRGANS